MQLLGFGAIGRQVALELAPERQTGTVRLWAAERDVAASRRHRAVDGVQLVTTGAGLDCLAWPETFGGADVVVECAGVAPDDEYGPAVIAAGTDLVLTSVGDLADPRIARQLLAWPGRLWVTLGVIGGFDVRGTAGAAGGLDDVRIRTMKVPIPLLRPWISAAEQDRLRALRPGDEPVTVFSGGPADAIERSPANVDVAVGLAWATRGRPAAVASLPADPNPDDGKNRLAEGDSGNRTCQTTDGNLCDRTSWPATATYGAEGLTLLQRYLQRIH